MAPNADKGKGKQVEAEGSQTNVAEKSANLESDSDVAVEVDDDDYVPRGVQDDPHRLSERMADLSSNLDGGHHSAGEGHHPCCPNHPEHPLHDDKAADAAPDPTLYEIAPIEVNLQAFVKLKKIPGLDKQLKNLRDNKHNIKKVVWDRQWSLKSGQRFKKNDQNEYKVIFALVEHYKKIADELRTIELTDLHITEYDELREYDQEGGTGDMLWNNQTGILMDKTRGKYLEDLAESYGSNKATKRLSFACNTFPRLGNALTDVHILLEHPELLMSVLNGERGMSSMNLVKIDYQYPNLEVLKFHFINSVAQDTYAEPFFWLKNLKLLILTFELNDDPTGYMVYKRNKKGDLQRVHDEDEIFDALHLEIPQAA